MKWFFLTTILKVAKWNGGDPRNFKLKNHKTTAELTDFNPITQKQLKQSKWFIFAERTV